MAFNISSVVDRAFSWIIFKISIVNFNWILIQTVHLRYNWFYVPFLRKSLKLFCSVTRCIIVLKNDFIITEPSFYRWNQNIIRDYNVYNCINFWSNDCHIPLSFKWHVNIFSRSFEIYFFSLSGHLFTFHLKGTSKNSASSVYDSNLLTTIKW